MSWFSTLLSKIGIEKTVDVAAEAAKQATTRFIEYAATDEYTALYEHVALLREDTTMTGAQKMTRVLASAADDVRTWGEYFVRGVVEQILAQITEDES